MKKTVLFISLLAFGFWGAAAWAQTPTLEQMTFRLDDTIPETKTCTGNAKLFVTLIFNTAMRPDSIPKITFGLTPPFTQFNLPVGEKEWANTKTFVAYFAITPDVPPAEGDGLYKFMVSGATSAEGVKMAATWSDSIKNDQDAQANLYVSRKGKLTTSVNKLDFGKIKAGQSKNLSLNIKNVTCTSISFTRFVWSSPFDISNPPATLAPDANLTLIFRFFPTIRKAYADSVKIVFTSNQQPDSVTIKLSGIATGPEMVITPNPLPSFGTIDLGSSVSQKIHFTNRKAQPDSLSDSLKFSIKLNPATGYTISKDTLTIPPGKTDSVIVTFMPTESRNYISSLDFVTNDLNINRPTGRFSLALTGAGRQKAPPPAFPTFTYNWYGREGYINSSTMRICLPLTAEQASQIDQVRWKFTETANDTPKAESDTTKLGGGRKLIFENGCYYFVIPLEAKFTVYSSVRLYWYLWFQGKNGVSSYNNRALRYSSQIYYDVTPPVFTSRPSVTVGWTGGYAGYSNADNLTLCWNASDPSDIVEVRWKIINTSLATPVANAIDTTRGGGRKISGNCVTIPLKGKSLPQGRWYAYFWLIDGSGNSSHPFAKATETWFTYDITAPVAPTAPTSRNIPANVWFGHINNRTLTLGIDLPAGSRDAAAVRWKFKTPPSDTSSFNGTSGFTNRTSSSATFSVPFSSAWCGEGNLYYWLADSAGNSTARSNPVAPYKFDMCSPVITRWLTSPALGTKHTALVDTIRITDHNPVNWDSVLYRFGGARANQPPRRLEKISTQKIGDQLIQKFVARIPADGVTTRGLEYTIFAADTLKNRGAGPMAAFGNACEGDEGDHYNSWVPVRVKTVGDGEFRIDKDGNPVAQPNGRDAASYSLFSVPFELDKRTPKDVLEDDLGAYNKKNWRFFEYRANTWVEYNSTAPTISPFTPGRAFFMIVGDPDKVIDSGAGKTVTTVKTDTLVLEEGWNLIGNPFNFPIHRDQLHLINSSIPADSNVPSILTYERRWDYDDIMEPWKGYAIYVQRRVSAQPVRLVICPIATEQRIGKITAPATASAQDWTIQISATAGAALDSINYVGARRAAAAEYDDLDRFEPPMIGEYVSVYVDNASWSRNPMKYTADFRPLSEETYEWPLQVNSNAPGEVALEFSGMAKLPAGYEAYLVDEAYGIARNLRRNPEYRFAAGGNGIEKSLKLLVGKSETLQKYSQSVALVPKAFALSQNFPNPFAVKQGQTLTAIRYALPKSATVTVEVYNMLGQKVRTLVNGQMQAADYYLAAWDGRDELGKEVTSGVYVYRLLADSDGERFTSTKKLLFVK